MVACSSDVMSSPRGCSGLVGSRSMRRSAASTWLSAATMAAPMMPASLRSCGRHDLAVHGQPRDVLVGALADPAAEDHQVGPHQLLDALEVLVEVHRPRLPRQPAPGARGGGGPPLGGPPADLHLPELGVRDEDAVVEHARADAGPQRQEDDLPGLALADPEAHLGDPRRVGIVDDEDRALEEPWSAARRPGSRSRPGRCCRRT